MAVPLDLWNVFGSVVCREWPGYRKERQAMALESNCISVVFHHLEVVEPTLNL